MTSTRTSWLRALAIGAALLLLAALAFEFRSRVNRQVVAGGEIRLHDADTLRRLSRVHNLVDPAKPYPYRNPLDGPPAGTEIHWTLPLDLALIAVDPFVRGAYPNARPFEAAALWVNPIVGALTVLLFGALAMALFGVGRGIAVTALLVVSRESIAATGFAVADHQGLQDLCSAAAILGFALSLTKAARWPAIVTGVGLGLALWVTAESMVLSLSLMSIAAVTLLVRDDDAFRARCRSHATWLTITIGIAAIASGFEQAGGPFAFTWDEVSGFQIYQLLVFAVFLALAPLARRRWRQRPYLAVLGAAATAVVAGIVPLVLPPLAPVFERELDSFGPANLWTSRCVTEYRPLFSLDGTFYLQQAEDRLGLLVYALPLLVVGLLLAKRVAFGGRLALAVLAVGLFALAARESKLLHLFALVNGVLIVIGGERLLELATAWLPRRVLIARVVAVAAFAAVLYPRVAALPADLAAPAKRAQSAFDELIDWLGSVPAGRGSVLADWGIGAAIIYYADRPAVATNYHRNIEGIRDAFRFMVAKSWDEALPILERREVEYLVVEYDDRQFVQADIVLGTPDRHVIVAPPTIVRRGNATVAQPHWRRMPRLEQTLLRKLYTDSVPAQLELVWQSTVGAVPEVGLDGRPVRNGGSPSRVPRYRAFRVR